MEEAGGNMYQRYIFLLGRGSLYTQKSIPLLVGICTFATYCWMLLPLMTEIFLFKGRLIDNVVGFSTVPAAGDGTLTHALYVSLVPSEIETVSKTCPFKIGQYCLALLNSPHEEAYKHLFRGLLFT